MQIRFVSTWSVFVMLLLGGLLAGGWVLAPSTAQAATTSPDTTSVDHPYSDPVWLPLRTPAKVGCAKTGCDNSTGAHGFYAIDFLGAEGDPVYAAGAGIAHIGGNSGECQKAGSNADDPAHRGRWVWVDHGNGLVSQYRHLGSIAITDGQLVTPTTMLGGMGHSGDVEPCTTQYVHFEVRTGGINGTPIDFGSLQVCRSSGKASLPQIWGATSWDDPDVHPSPRLKTPQGYDNCMDPAWLNTPAAPTATAKVGASSAAVGWGTAPSGTDRIGATLEYYRTSDSTWVGTVYQQASTSATSTTFTGLTNGRRYRAQVFFHSSAGWSRGSGYVEAVPSAAPGATGGPRFLTWPKATYVHYGWDGAPANGSAVSSYTVAWRCAAAQGGAYGAWSKATQDTSSYYRNISDLSKYHDCEVKVRATNSAGTGPYSSANKVTR